MEVIKIKDLSFSYPNSDKKALEDINISVNSGDFVTVCGRSGCGKTTLARLIKPEIAPWGNLKGEILYNGCNIKNQDKKEQVSEIGFVMQNPDNQIVTDKVWHELAFGLESLGYDNATIRTRVSETASFFGIHNWFYKKTDELSGGQKQLLCLASVMVMQPKVLILDEPTSSLDPIAASEFLNAVKKVNTELGTTVILIEHRLEEAFPLSDFVAVMDGGRVIIYDTPKKVCEKLYKTEHEMFRAMPAPTRIMAGLKQERYPITVAEGKGMLLEYAKNNPFKKDFLKDEPVCNKRDVVLEVKDVFYRYEKTSPDTVKNLNLKIYKGEVFAILGGNGTGKTTAVSVMAGIMRPQRGKVLINGLDIHKSGVKYVDLPGLMPQDPTTLFSKSVVYQELYDLTDKSLGKVQREIRVNDVMDVCMINGLKDMHPYDLSGGEQQRLALAMVLIKKPNILILDEPTKGMDGDFKKTFSGILKSLNEKGVTVIMVSHDIEFCGENAHRCAMFFDGSITSLGEARQFFSGNSFYTTTTNRMAREVLNGAILPRDVLMAAGYQEEEKKKDRSFYDKDDNIKDKNDHKGDEFCHSMTDEHDNKKEDKTPQKLRGKGYLSYLIILICVPLTIFFGRWFFDDRKYYFISLLIILETFFAMYLGFEKRRPKANEVVLISSLCAIAIVGRTAFFMIPQFKPVAAIVILSGICFGGETGFLVGSITAFVSNFFFGQGPWTPWQMFAFGMIGLISGLLFSKVLCVKTEKVKKSKFLLSVYGFLVTVCVYGLIMNVSSAFMTWDNPSIAMVLSTLALGLPFDLIHGLSTGVFMWIISKEMINKLERIKTKYGFGGREVHD